MGTYARFLKRLFAFFIDLTLVIILTWVLWLFPFQFVVGNSIQQNYNKEVRNKIDEISYKYEGKKDLFGSSGTADGYIPKLDKAKSEGALSESNYNEHIANFNVAYTRNIGFVDDLLISLNTPYGEDLPYEQQEYVNIDELYTYLFYAYNLELKYPHNEEYVSYNALRDAGTITSDDELKTIINTYKSNLTEKYVEEIEILVRAFKYYDSLNPNSKILDLPTYKTVSSEYNSLSKKKIKDLSSTLEESDIEKLKNAVNSYKTYFDTVTSKERLGTSVSADETQVKLNDEAYNNFFYVLMMKRFEEMRPYYIQKYKFNRYATIYSLIAFVVLFSVYTVVFSGQTLGRRSVKIKLIGKDENKKLNPLVALYHDIIVRLLYVLLIGFFSFLIALVVALTLTVADVLMIRYSKQNKTIRDIITGTRVIETGF